MIEPAGTRHRMRPFSRLLKAVAITGPLSFETIFRDPRFVPVLLFA